MWTESPQGMHITLHLNGTVVLNRFASTHAACQSSCESCEFCDINLYFIFSIPRGVYIDPFELQVSATIIDPAHSPLPPSLVQSRHDFLSPDLLVSLPPSYGSSFSPESFAEKSSPFWIGIELFRLPVNLETLSARFSFDLPLHLRYHLQSPFERDNGSDQTPDSILSLIDAPEIFVGQFEAQEGWKPGIWIDFGEAAAADSNLRLETMTETALNSQRHAKYQSVLPLTSLCGCIRPFLSSAHSHAFSVSSLSLLSSDCSESHPSPPPDSLLQLEGRSLCSPRVSLAMPFPFGLSSGLVILVTTLVISLTTLALGGVLIHQKRRESKSESYRER
jgi:hypothetical protein